MIHYAEFWGIGDDVERDLLVEQAPKKVRQNLKAVVEKSDKEFDSWLAGPESYSDDPSNEYVAYSAMRMAADYMLDA